MGLALQGEVLDEGGWEVYKEDWRYFFDCMLAPVARQASKAKPCSVLLSVREHS